MRQLFIAGLIILLPLVITYWIIAFLVNLVTTPFLNLAVECVDLFPFLLDGALFFTHEEIVIMVSKVLITLFLALFIFVIGFIAHWIIVRSLIHLSDKIMKRLPLVSKIYKSCKDFTDAIFSPRAGSFNQVVLVPYPSPHLFSIGLVTNTFSSTLMRAGEREYYSVLIPGTPNPTIGFVLFFEKQDVILLDMTVEEAIKYIISAGSSIPRAHQKRIGRIE